MSILERVSLIQKELAQSGIQKAGHNKVQNYRFRGIDQVLQSLSALLPKHGVFMTVEYTDINIQNGKTKNGADVRFVTLKGQYTFHDVENGSTITHIAYGEGADTNDKAVQKAMSSAMKYAILQGFVVPINGVLIDSDNENPLTDNDNNSPLGNMSDEERQQFERKEWIAALEKAAKNGGIDKLKDTWQSMSPAARQLVGKDEIDRIKGQCNEAD